MFLRDFVQKIQKEERFSVVNFGDSPEDELTKVFCCDLLSIAMSKAPVYGIWVTVIANINTLAVAALTETSCVILAEGVKADEALQKKANMEGICLLETELPVFEAACAANRCLHE